MMFRAPTVQVLKIRLTVVPTFYLPPHSIFSWGGWSVDKVGKPTEKRPLRRPRWEDNIRLDHKEIGINTRNWIHSAQDRDYWRVLVNVALNLRVP